MDADEIQEREERYDRLEMQRERVERIRDYVPSEEFSQATAEHIARVEQDCPPVRLADVLKQLSGN